MKKRIKINLCIVCISAPLVFAYATGCRSNGDFHKRPSPIGIGGNTSMTLLPEKREYDSSDVHAGSTAFWATIKNHGHKPITIAHPAVCLPAEYEMGKAFQIKVRHGKSEILLIVKKPDGNTVILRDGPHYFDPHRLDRFTIQPGESMQFYVGWFFQNARGRWENDRKAATLFSDKGLYRVTLVYRNFFPKAVVYDPTERQLHFIEVWTGEIRSNEVKMKIE